MPPILALILWFVCLVLLFRFDPAKERTSVALWVPIIALFIIGSRNPSQWLGGTVSITAQSFEEGNPLDRAISLLLILLAIWILTSRSFRWGEFFTRNLALTVLITFGLLSVTWSDFPFIAFKRWFRDLGNYLFVLVVLSDAHPEAAIRTVLRRLFYLLIPLSILLNKYFPDYSRSFDAWSGVGYYAGASTSKNMLGLMCLISGLFFLWDTVARWPERKQRATKRILYVNLGLLLMTGDLLLNAHSTTSTVCMLLGASVILAAYSKTFRRYPGVLKGIIPAAFLVYLVLNFGLGLNGAMAESVGKDPTLTDRTKIWAFLLSMHPNPIIGTGYQSFWLGSRLEFFWNNAGLGHLNEAHNGYLGLYLDQGVIGVGLLVIFLIASYRLICRRLSQRADVAVLGLAGWICIVFYNMSEASFEGGLLYLVFLILGISVPVRALRRAQNSVLGSPMNPAGRVAQAASGSTDIAGPWRS